MSNPRLNKLLRELWMNQGRSLLVILSIAVGVAAIGAVIGTQQTLARELPASYAKVVPASIHLITEPFQEEFLQTVRKVEGVIAVESRSLANIRLQTGPDRWQTMLLTVYPDFEDIQVNKITPVSGDWPPPDREIVIERASLALTGAQVGDYVTVQLPDGSLRRLRVSGLAHDLNEPAGTFTNQISAYTTLNTLEWLGFPKSFNEILIAVDPPDTFTPEESLAYSWEVARRVRDRVEKTGKTVQWTTVKDPGQHWFQPYLAPMTSVLSVLGGLALALSGFLVINTISALLAQQIRQVGIMKAVGGRTGQISIMFIVMVLIFGLFALAIAVPAGVYGARFTLQALAGFINFDPPVYQLDTRVLIIQTLLSLLVPSLTAFFPIRQGTRIPVREAISHTGISMSAAFGSSKFDQVFTQILNKIGALPNPVVLSIRNTFRRKSRLILTLVTLILGSAIFIAVQHTQASLVQTLDAMLEYYNFDVAAYFERPYRVEQISAITLQAPAVKNAETWGVADAHRIRPDGSEGESIMFVAPPPGTEMIRPILIAGRWLDPKDENAVVINSDLVRQEPDLTVGSEVVLKIEGKETRWVVVGIVQSIMMGPWAYTNEPYFAYRLNKKGLASAVYISTNLRSEADVQEAVRQLENLYLQNGIRLSSISTVTDLRSATILQFQVIISFLLVMALLIALVGGLGLMGTMSLNVIERSREIGIMRAIGARDGDIRQIVIIEGVFIGLLSWLAGAVLALPLGKLLNDIVGQGFLQTPLNDAVSLSGALIWLGFITVLSILSSILPARRATREPIREVLAYE